MVALVSTARAILSQIKVDMSISGPLHRPLMTLGKHFSKVRLHESEMQE